MFHDLNILILKWFAETECKYMANNHLGQRGTNYKPDKILQKQTNLYLGFADGRFWLS